MTSLRTPTVNNPMMNPPIIAYDAQQKYQDYYHYADLFPTYNQNRIEKDVNQDLYSDLYQDAAGFIYQKNNSQREFYSVPVGTVPNKQTEFAEWLYAPQEDNCKSTSIYMNNGPRTNKNCMFSNVSVPTNYGIIRRKS